MIKRASKYITVVAALSLSLSAMADDSAQKPSAVQDLRYGVILYDFFQQSYFDALTESMVGESRQDMPHHQQSAKLLRGGMSLSYGMGQQAETLFTELLDTLEEPAKRDRAWFYLARLYYLLGERSKAQTVLMKIEGELESKLQQEAVFMNANLLLHDQSENDEHQRMAAAQLKIDELPLTSPWLAYYYFNRGSALTLSGQWQQGVDAFQQIKTLSIAGEEGATLSDRAFTASGFARLGGGDYQSAIDDFLQVRLESPLVGRALLGYGWAAAQQDNYQLALSPWQALAKQSLMSPSVQESLLAVPYAYEKLDAQASALIEYQRAVTVFEQELAGLATAITVYQNQSMLADLTEKPLGGDWVSGEDYLPLNDEAPYLAHLIAQEHFQSAVKDLSDLRRIQAYLQQSDERLLALRGVLDVQQRVWAENLNLSQRQQYRQHYEQLLVIKQRLQKQQVSADKEANGRRFVTPEEIKLWQLTSHAQAAVTVLQQAGEEVNDEQQQLSLYQGLLIWQANENDSSRRWEFSKQLNTLNALLSETEQRLARLDQLNSNRYDAEFADQVSALQLRLQQKNTNVDALIARAETQLRRLAVSELEKQRQRLSHYMGQAKLAIARLYDMGSTEFPQ